MRVYPSLTASIRFSVVLPTCGRAGLGRALASLTEVDLWPDDEVVIVADGEDIAGTVLALADEHLGSRYPWRLEVLEPAGGCWGQPARNYGVQHAQGTHLIFTQDDQELQPGSLTTLRSGVALAPDRLHCAYVVPRCGYVVPDEWPPCEAHIDADCVVWPRWFEPVFGLRYNGDWDALGAAFGTGADEPVLHPLLLSVHQACAQKIVGKDGKWQTDAWSLYVAMTGQLLSI